MALYCTPEGLKLTDQELAELTTEEGDEYDAAVVNEAIERAGMDIDVHLSPRYVTPFDPAPGVVREMAGVIAAYYLHQRREHVPEPREQAYKNVTRLLERMAEGKAGIPGAELVGADSTSGPTDLESADRRFTRETMEGF